MKKKYIIFGKGYANTTVSDPFIRNKVIKLMKNEAEFKVIDYFEEGSKEHDVFRYGPDNILKPV